MGKTVGLPTRVRTLKHFQHSNEVLEMSDKYKNRGSAWFNNDPKSTKSPHLMGSATVGKGKTVWMNAWIQAPDDQPEIKKAVENLVKVCTKHWPKTNKGVKPLVSVSFKKQ